MNHKSDSCANGIDANGANLDPGPSQEIEANPTEDDYNHDDEDENFQPIHMINGSDNSRKTAKSVRLSCLCDQERYYLGKYTRRFDGCCSSRSLNITTVHCKECDQVLDLSLIPGHFIQHLIDPIELSYFCIKCCSTYGNLNELHQHRVAVFNEMSPNFCSKCNKKCLNWQLHKDHWIKTHSQENFYHFCPLCDFQSTLFSRMKLHVSLTHRVIPCPYCLMLTDIHRFAINDTYRDENWKETNLNRELSLFWIHLQKHISVKDKFSCPKCVMRFLNSTDLADHMGYHSFVSRKPSMDLSNNEFHREQENKGDYYNKEEFKKYFPKIKLKSNQSSYILKTNNNSPIVRPKTKKTTRKNAAHRVEGLSSNEPPIHQMPLNVSLDPKYRSKSKTKSLQSFDYADFSNILSSVSNSALFTHAILHTIAMRKSYFLPNSLLIVKSQKFRRVFHDISCQNKTTSDFINLLNAKLLKNYDWKCLTCEQKITDLTHFAAKPIVCPDEHCFYKTYCTNDMLLHQKYIDRNNLNEPTFFIIGSRFLEEPDRRLVTEERIIQAREFDPLYQVEDEVEEIRKEFPTDPCPFYIHVCIQCALSFLMPMSAAYHVFHLDNTIRNDLGAVFGLEQTHVVYRRCLIRTFRYNNEEIQNELNIIQKEQAENILAKMDWIFRTEIKKNGKKNRTYASFNGRYLSPATRQLNLNDFGKISYDLDNYSNLWSRPLSLAMYGGIDRYEGPHNHRSSDADQNEPKSKKSRK